MRPLQKLFVGLCALLLPAAVYAQAPTINSVAWSGQTINWSASPVTVSYTVNIQGSWIQSTNTLTATDVAGGKSVVLSNEVTTPYSGNNPASSISVKATVALPVSTSISFHISEANGVTNPDYASEPSVSKPHITGLTAQGQIDVLTANTIDTSMAQLNDHGSGQANVWAASVVAVGWNGLQGNNTTGYGQAVDTTLIEQALANIASYNKTNSTNVVGKLRVFTGTHTPTWAMTYSGGAVRIQDDDQKTTEYQNFPEFWTDAYATAFNDLTLKLANIYDRDPRIQEVSMESCSAKTDEPFIHDTDSTSLAAMTSKSLAQPFTDTLLQNCLSQGYVTYHNDWPNTPIDYAINIYTTTSGAAAQDYSLNLMATFRSSLQGFGVINNHDVDDPPPGGTAIYAGYDGYQGYLGLGAPLTLQAYTPTPTTKQKGETAWEATFYWAACQSTLTDFELFPSTRTKVGAHLATYSTDDLEYWATSLAGGVPASIQTKCNSHPY